MESKYPPHCAYPCMTGNVISISVRLLYGCFNSLQMVGSLQFDYFGLLYSVGSHMNASKQNICY